MEQDSRGILHPLLLRRRVTLARRPPPAALQAVVEWFWTVRWDLPAGTTHRQQLLTHPGANVSVGHPDAAETGGPPRPVEAMLYGVARELSTRVLRDSGWTVAALMRPGGLGAFITGSAAALTGRAMPLAEVLHTDEQSLIARVCAAQADQETQVRLLASALESAIVPGRVRAAAEVAEAASIAETSRDVRTLGDLCAATGMGPRTLQRMFLQFAGVSPTWVIRRYRLIEAAEAVREGQPVSWAAVAADLGYADQAHLSRDFRTAIGQPPGAYAQDQAIERAGHIAQP